MKSWKCPRCGRIRFYSSLDNVIIKICHTCQVSMEIVEDKNLEVIYNG